MTLVDAAPASERLTRLLAGAGPTMGFQPIVEIETEQVEQVVGFEALVRPGPESGWADPGELFAGARALDRLVELDRACRRSALQAVATAGLPEGTAVFLNVEAASLGHPAAEEDALPGLLEDTRGVRLVLELTERQLAARPAELLAAVQRAREQGWRIALDDVGAARSSLALMQLVRPDVVKLDLQLMQRAVGRHTAGVANVVAEQAEQSGALILAEGIETPAMLETALAMGATLGQGFLFGRAAPLPDPVVARPMGIPRLTGALGRTDQSPFAAIARRLTTRRADKPLLAALSRRLEDQAIALNAQAVVLSAFQDARYFTDEIARRYARLAERAPLVAVLGRGLTAEPAPGVRGGALEADDPICREWGIAVISPHFCAGLVALDLGEEAEGEDERRFEYVLTYDRELVLELAGSLACRISHGLPVVEPEACHDDHDGHVGCACTGEAAAHEDASDPDLPRGRAGVTRPSGDGSGLVPTQLVAYDAVTASIALADATRPGFPLVYINPAFERLTGSTAEGVLGRSCSLLQGAGTAPSSSSRLAIALREGQGARETLLNYRADGTPFWNEVTLSPMHDDAGRVVQYLGVQQDVTEQVEALRSLRTERDRVQHALESRGISVVLLSHGLRVEMLNPAAELLLGQKEEAALGTDGPALFGLVDREHARVVLHAALASQDGHDHTLETNVGSGGRVRQVVWRVRRLSELSGAPSGVLLSGEDVTERRAREDEHEWLAHHDTLTGLANRRALSARLDAILGGVRSGTTRAAVLYLDVDDFKSVNDRHGHTTGDAVLRNVAERILDAVRQTDLVARVGGDELVVLMSDLGADAAALVAAAVARLAELQRVPVRIGRAELAVTISIGVALAPDDGTDEVTLLAAADARMYEAKARRREPALAPDRSVSWGG